MKLYRVYSKGEIATAKFVPEGFSFLGFLLTPLWALYHRLWWLFLVALVLEAVIRGTVGSESHWYPVLQVGWAVLAGAFAYDWLGWHVKRKGWEMVDVVSGRSLVEAQRRYYDRALRQVA